MSIKFPERGQPWSDIEARMSALAEGDVKWRDGKTAIYVFNAGDEVGQVKKAAYAMFSEENGLGPAAFPSLKRMEAEVLDYALGLLHAPDGAALTKEAEFELPCDSESCAARWDHQSWISVTCTPRDGGSKKGKEFVLMRANDGKWNRFGR